MKITTVWGDRPKAQEFTTGRVTDHMSSDGHVTDHMSSDGLELQESPTTVFNDPNHVILTFYEKPLGNTERTPKYSNNLTLSME